MAIPKYNSQGLLPPHNGDARDLDGGSPYHTTTLELCHTFGTTRTRREILRGFFRLRAALAELELNDGWQWLDGRFLEKDRGHNEPELIQVVTFYTPSPLLDDPMFTDHVNRINDFDLSHRLFRVDHNYVSLELPLPALVHNTRHYAALLSHQSETGIWKGMLQVNLNTPQDDAAALQRLEEMERS